MASSHERRYYVVTNLPTGDLGPYSRRELQEELSAGRIHSKDPVRSGLGTNYGTVQEVLSHGTSSATIAVAAGRRTTQVMASTTPQQAAPAPTSWPVGRRTAILLILAGLAPILVITWVILGSSPEPVAPPVTPMPAFPPTTSLSPASPATPSAAQPGLDAAPSTPATGSSAASLLRVSNFREPPIEIFDAWERDAASGCTAEQVDEDGRKFLRMTSRNGGGILLSQGVTLSPSGRYELRAQVRLMALSPGKEWWHTARVTVLWKNDQNNRNQSFRHFEVHPDWQQVVLPVPTRADLSEAKVWIGLAHCSGMLDIAEVSLVAVP